MTAAQIERTREALLREGVVLCVRLGRDVDVLAACRAAIKGGLRALEITLTTPGALDAIRTLAAEGAATVGAGTVLTCEEVRRVAEAGACFAMSPAFDPDVVEEAHRRGLLAIPGAATPTEIVTAWRHGARLVKVFPAGALGGPAYLRTVRGPLPDVPLLASNGPTAETVGAYLAAGADAVGVGSEVFPEGVGLERVEAAACRLRAAFDAARAAPAHAASAASVEVTEVPLAGGVARGVACEWAGGQYVAIMAPRGIVGCGIFDLEVCERFGFAVAMAHGTPEAPLAKPADVLRARVDTVSSKARELGIREGMTGARALERLLD